MYAEFSGIDHCRDTSYVGRERAIFRVRRRHLAQRRKYLLENGRRVYVLGEGRLINLAAAEGHPSSVMDMSFANQALCAAHLLSHAKDLEKKVYGVPRAIDERIARLKLESMGVRIDALTDEQKTYLASWEQGT